jgi:DNA-binding NarL/FixJ family response regulator
MGRMGALRAVLRQLVQLDTAGAIAVCERATDPYIVALRAFAEFFGQRFETAAQSAALALDEADDAEAVALARAMSGLAAAGWPRGLLPQGGDPLAAALEELELLADVQRDSRAFILYLCAEAALACGRLSLASEFVANSGELPPDFLLDGDQRHPFAVLMQVMRARLLGFQGRVTEGLAAGEAAVASAKEPASLLLAEATMCLLLGEAAQPPSVRAIADRLEANLPRPDNYLSCGCYLLVAYGLIATGDVARSARFLLAAGGTPDLENLTIVDRALGLELLAAAAIAENDLDAAEAWQERARPLLDNPIAAPTVQRLVSRVELLAGRPESAADWAQRAIDSAVATGRMVETAETEIVLSRARAVLSAPEEAREALQAMVDAAMRAGRLAARRSAASELRSIGRRLRPRPGSGWEGLSRRERDVALLVVEGFGNRAIAAELHLSEHTVRAHVSRVLAAFGVASRSAVGAHLPDAVSPDSNQEQPAALTPRQDDVADCIARGMTNEQISHELGISVKTVEKHVTEILHRWHVASRVGVARTAHARKRHLS